jgi:hypothetical protein
MAGGALSLQARTSSRSLFALELQSLASAREALDGRSRTDLGALLSGRFFLWNAAVAPYLDLAGGMGQAFVDAGSLHARAPQFIGRIGVGLELRLGPHLVLEAQVADVHRLRLDAGGPSIAAAALIGDHERSTELRGGVALRF